MTPHFAQITDIGLERELNEDALWSSPVDPAFFVIADGCGGMPRGEVASRIAVDTLKEAYASAGRTPDAGWLGAAFLKANAAILKENAKYPRHEAMATTLTASLFKVNRIVVGHVGDSRLYRIREGEAMQLTRDHSSMWGQLLRAVGSDSGLKVDVFEDETRAGDVYLQATDGLYPLFKPRELAAIALGPDLEDACRKFVAAAKDRGGLDNITLQLVRF